MNNSILKGVNVNPIKRNMEEGQFSLMRKIFRGMDKINYTVKVKSCDSSTQNSSFKDSSSRTQRQKAIAIGKQEYNSTVSYRSYESNEVNHIKHKIRNAGTVAPKKSNIKI